MSMHPGRAVPVAPPGRCNDPHGHALAGKNIKTRVLRELARARSSNPARAGRRDSRQTESLSRVPEPSSSQALATSRLRSHITILSRGISYSPPPAPPRAGLLLNSGFLGSKCPALSYTCTLLMNTFRALRTLRYLRRLYLTSGRGPQHTEARPQAPQSLGCSRGRAHQLLVALPRVTFRKAPEGGTELLA